jgi:hypothetical protein
LQPEFVHCIVDIDFADQQYRQCTQQIGCIKTPNQLALHCCSAPAGVQLQNKSLRIHLRERAVYHADSQTFREFQ